MAPLALLLVAATGAVSNAIQLEIDHDGPLVLGTVESVPVTILAPESEGEARPLRVSVNVGAFEEVVRKAPGVYESRFRLPATRYPQVALVAVWRETGPAAPITFLRIPLSGKTTLPVGTRRGAEVSVVVGEEIFGPVKANRRGRAVVPIVVPPGVTEVVARSTSGTTESQKTVPVDVPPYNRLTLAVTPYLIEADGRASITAHVFYDRASPPPIERVVVLAPRGEVTPLSAEKGHYRFRYVPKRGESAAEVTLRARVRGDRRSKAEATLSLGTPIPQRIVVRRAAPGLVADGESRTTVEVLLMDKLGLGVAQRTLTTTTTAGRFTGGKDLGGGRYALTLVGPNGYPASGRAEVTISVSDRPEVIERLVLPVSPAPWPSEAIVSLAPSHPIADGSPFTLEVLAVDGAGRGFEEGLTITASAAAVGEVVNAGHGRYRAEVIPEEGAETVDIALTHPSGRFRQHYRAELRRPPSWLAIGAGGGLAYHSTITYTAAVELSARLPVFDRRLALFLSAQFRRISRRITLLDPLPADAEVTAHLTMVPAILGLSYDLLAGERWRLYGAVAFALLAYQQEIDSDLLDAPVNRGIGFGGEGSVGVQWYGVFAQASFGYTRIEEPGLVGPKLLASLIVGYRLGLL